MVRHHLRPRRPHRLVGLVAVPAAVIALASPAWAHVGAAATAGTGGATTVTFTFTHGCGTEPTTSLKMKLPDGTTDVAAQSPPGWTATVSGTELSWSGGSVPNTQKGEFVATMRIPGTKGETVYLPTVQGCPTSQETWLEKSADPEAPSAAPRIVLTQTVTPSPTTAATPTTVAAPGTTAALSAKPSTNGTGTPAGTEAMNQSQGTLGQTATGASSSSSSGTALAVAIGLLGLAVLAIAVVASRRRRGAGDGDDAVDDAGDGEGAGGGASDAG